MVSPPSLSSFPAVALVQGTHHFAHFCVAPPEGLGWRRAERSFVALARLTAAPRGKCGGVSIHAAFFISAA